MPYTVFDPQLFFDAVVTRIATSTGNPVGLAEAPANNVYPYVVVYPLNDDPPEGALNDPTQLVTWMFQVTAVSDGPGGAQVMQRRVRTALHGHVPVVAGVSTTPIELDDGSGITRDDAVSPPLFYSTDRYAGKVSTT